MTSADVPGPSRARVLLEELVLEINHTTKWWPKSGKAGRIIIDAEANGYVNILSSDTLEEAVPILFRAVGVTLASLITLEEKFKNTLPPSLTSLV